MFQPISEAPKGIPVILTQPQKVEGTLSVYCVQEDMMINLVNILIFNDKLHLPISSQIFNNSFYSPQKPYEIGIIINFLILWVTKLGLR